MFQIVGDTKAVERLLREWPQRARRLRSQYLYTVAHQAYEDILRKVPKDPELEDYRDALTFARVTGISGDDDAYAVFLDARKSRVRKLDGPKMLLYVRAKRSLRRTPEDIKILERYNPWTLDTLPYTPKKRFAEVVSRIATKSAVAKAAEQRKRDRFAWKRELVQAGVRGLDKKRQKISRKVSAVPEVAVQALTLEFGLSGKSRAHWRPAASRARRRGMRLLEKSSMLRALFDARFTEWRRWPTPVSGRVSLREVRKFSIFQKKLGLG